MFTDKEEISVTTLHCESVYEVDEYDLLHELWTKII